jgi:hypothetical protein
MATPIKGLSAVNQIGFVFMLFSQAFEGGHFRKSEISFPSLRRDRRHDGLQARVNTLTVSTSKTRPQSIPHLWLRRLPVPAALGN